MSIVRVLRRAVLGAIVLASVVQSPAAIQAQAPFQSSPTLFSGQATAVKGTVLGMPITLVDTGPVAAGGGSLEAHLLCYPDGPNCFVGAPDLTSGMLSAEVLNATVVAQGNHSRARASVADLTLNAAGQSIVATFLEARADAQCADGQAFVRGDADIARIVVNGQEIAISGDINQRVDLSTVGFVVINEQVAQVDNDNGDITVRALHIVIPGVLDLIIAEAHADILCGQRFCPADKDFITGGGWFDVENTRRNFAVAGGFRNGDFWGHLLYIDHGTGLKVKGTGVTAYVVTGATTRHIEGTCEINGRPGTYQVDVDDQGEPGRGRDRFRITLSNSQTADDTLSGGNIQLHTCK